MFLSQLNKITSPLTSLDIEIKVSLHAPCQEWLTSEEQNVGLFKYSLNYWGQSVEGEFVPKQVSLKDQIKLNQGKQSKKGTEQQDEEKLHQEEKEEEEYFKDMDLLTDQEKEWKIKEWKFREASIKFDKTLQIHLDSNQVEKFESLVQKKKGDYVYITRSCTIKDAKQKPKNMQPQDMIDNSILFWLDMSALLTPGTKESTVQKVFLKQNQNDEIQKMDLSNSHVISHLILSQPLLDDIKEIYPSLDDLVMQSQVQIVKKNFINQFKAEVAQYITILNTEYMNMYTMDKNQGLSKTLTLQKLQDLKKRKDNFLTEFYRTGKFEFMKEKFREVIIKICVDTYKKKGLPLKKPEQKFQMLSELNVSLSKIISETINQVIQEQFLDFHEDIVIKQDLVIKDQNRIETKIESVAYYDRVMNSSYEYEILCKFKLAEQVKILNQNLLNLILHDQTNAQSWFHYTKFLLRRNHYNQAETALNRAIQCNPDEIEYKKLLTLLYINRGSLIQNLLQNDKNNLILLQIVYTIYKIYLKDSQKAEIFQEKIRTNYMYQSGLLQKSVKQSEDIFTLPSYKQKMQLHRQKMMERPSLNSEQIDSICYKFIEYLNEYHLFPIMERVMTLLVDKNSIKYEEYNAFINIFQQEYPTALKFYSKMLKSKIPDKNKICKFLLLKANVCYLTDKYFEFEETIYEVLSIQKKAEYYLRQAWQDAIETFKTAIKQQEQSQLSWLGLGIAQLRVGDYVQSEESFQQAIILELFNPDTYGYYALLCLHQGHRAEQLSICLNRMIQHQIQNTHLLFELFVLLRQNTNTMADKLLTILLETCDDFSLLIVFAQKRQQQFKDEAKQLFMRAQKVAKNDTDVAKVQEMINSL